MSHEHIPTGEEHVGLSGEHGSQAEDEARAVELVATEVMPAARVEELTRATTEFIYAENILTLNAEAVTDLQAFESTGTTGSATATTPVIDPARPPSDRTLARRAAFQRTSAKVWSAKPMVDPASSPTPATVGKKLVAYYESRSTKDPAEPDPTRDRIEQEAASFGTSLDEYARSRMPVDATDPACADSIVAAMRRAGVAPEILIATVERFTNSLVGTDMDVAAAVKAGDELLTLLNKLETGLGDSGRPLVETARYEEMSFGLSLYAGQVLQRIADGGSVTPRSETARSQDLSTRLGAVAATPHALRTGKLADARGRASRTQDLITRATKRIDEARTALAGLAADEQVLQATLDTTVNSDVRAEIEASLAQNALEQQKLNADIASDQTDVTSWERRLLKQKEEVDTLVMALKADATAFAQVRATISSPAKGKKFILWRDKVDQTAKSLGRLGLDADDLAGLKELLAGVRDGVDEEFARQMRALADLNSGATLSTILDDGWKFARRLSDIQAALREFLKRPRAKASDVEAATHQLQMLMSALAGYLSERVAVTRALGRTS